MMRRIVVILLVLVLVLALSVPVAAADEDGGGFISGIVDGILNGLRRLFVPDRDYFVVFQEDISSRFNAKFAGIIQGVQYFKYHFSNLRSYSELDTMFTFEFQSGIMKGMKVDMLKAGKPFLTFVRAALTGLVGVLTAFLCYRKVIQLVRN